MRNPPAGVSYLEQEVLLMDDKANKIQKRKRKSYRICDLIFHYIFFSFVVYMRLHHHEFQKVIVFAFDTQSFLQILSFILPHPPHFFSFSLSSFLFCLDTIK